MKVSLNEIQLTVRKAVQGRGLAYGLAEEAGLAARFLARSGLDAIALWADVLEEESASSSPLIIGPSLGDALLLDPPQPITLRGVSAPALLPGYLSDLMRPLRIAWDDAAYSMDGGRIRRQEAGRGVDVTVEFLAAPPRPSPQFAAAWEAAPAHGVEVEPAPWRRLQAHAAKILIPETEYSRLHGAGAGFIDRD